MAELPFPVCTISGTEVSRIGRALQSIVEQAGWLVLTLRPVRKFLRANVLRLGFLKDQSAYGIAWLGTFATVKRHAMVHEAHLTSASRYPHYATRDHRAQERSL
jgi:hypothetical protein